MPLIRLDRAFAGVCFAVLCSAAVLAADPTPSVIEKDGLIADVKVSSDQAVVRWRFLKPLQTPLKEITADIDGQSLGVPEVQPYPAPGDETRILSLFDISGKNRLDGIASQMALGLMLGVSKPSHVPMAFAVYGSEMRLLVPRNLDELATALGVTTPEDVEPSLAVVLRTGIEAVSSLPAQRRGLFVFSDGHSQPPLRNDVKANGERDGDGCDVCTSTIADLALKNGVAITFILIDSDRPADRNALVALAERTGGQAIGAAEIEPFVRNPYAILDSGGTAVFPIAQRLHYFWEPAAILHVAFSYGDSTAQLSAAVPFPAATAEQTVAYVWQQYQLYVVAAGLILLALIAGLVIGTRRRGVATIPDAARTPDAEHTPVALAVLQDTTNGAVYSVATQRARIGRAPDNEIVISDNTVSPLHAVLHLLGDGTFQLENKSEVNGARVNGQAVQKQQLSDGDVITLGGTSLRFARVRASV